MLPPCARPCQGRGKNVCVHPSESTGSSTEGRNLLSVLGVVGTSLPLKWEAVCLSFRECLYVSLSWIFVSPADRLRAFEVCMLGYLGCHSVTTISRSFLYPHPLQTHPEGLLCASEMDGKPIGGYIWGVLWLWLCPPPHCRAPKGQKPDATLQASSRHPLQPLWPFPARSHSDPLKRKDPHLSRDDCAPSPMLGALCSSHLLLLRLTPKINRGETKAWRGDINAICESLALKNMLFPLALAAP